MYVNKHLGHTNFRQHLTYHKTLQIILNHSVNIIYLFDWSLAYYNYALYCYNTYLNQNSHQNTQKYLTSQKFTKIKQTQWTAINKFL